MNKLLTLSGLLLLGGATSFAQVPGSSIDGIILGDAGKPVAAATLVYTLKAQYIRDLDGHRVIKNAGFTKSVTVGQDGRFLVAGLPSGQYDICAFGPEKSQVSGCEWDGGSVIDLSPGQKVETLTRFVHDGTIITFQVHDVGGKIDFPDEKGRLDPRRRFFLGVSSPSGAYHRGELILATANLKVFRVIIPKQSSVKLFIDSELDVTDVIGNFLEKARPTTFAITPKGVLELTVELTAK